MLLASTGSGYPLLDLMWTMLMFAGFVLWIWLLVVVFSDLFRRQDISGWAKAGWTALLLVLPLVSVLAYLIVQGRDMAERRRADAAVSREDFERDVRAITADQRPDPVDQIATAKRLLEQGDITREEFEILKRRALGLPTREPAAHAT